tara:strand:- start:1046 stop:1228 length:183 start_codon:yes stop_codon:yes gene_type:complete
MKKALGKMCAGEINKGSVFDDIVWYGWEDICDKHGAINCGCEKTAEDIYPNTEWDENEPF